MERGNLEEKSNNLAHQLGKRQLSVKAGE